MPGSPLLCYITDRRQFPGDESAQRRQLLRKIAEASGAGVDFVQLREKNLPARDLESFASEAVRILRDPTLRTENRERGTVLFINSRTDVALAVGADGVHLRSDDVSPGDVRRIWHSSGPDTPVRVAISVSCHQPSEVEQAAKADADLALFAPVFEKKDAPGMQPAGLDALRSACRHNIRVLALGGVTFENAAACLEAGAAGIAAIRLFQEHDVAEVVRRLRAV
jgi:thiamine-phosphate pyrophosphorylase